MSAQTFPTSPGGVASIFSEKDEYGNNLVYSKVSVESDAALVIEIADKNGILGDPIYVISGSLPITFTGYDITDLKIKTANSTATLGIIAWR